MKSIRNKLCFLKNMLFLQAEEGVSGLVNVELLENGKRLSNEIENQWCETFPPEITKKVNAPSDKFTDISNRLSFIYSEEFRKNIQILKEVKTKKNPYVNIIQTTSKLSTNYEESGVPFMFKCNKSRHSQLLITDYFSHTNCGLAKLYNIQRERKIWWMRFSADPSRYFLKPFELLNKETPSGKDMINAQSTTITSRLAIGNVGVENITLVPLSEACLHNEDDFKIYDERTKKKQLPAVIRCVIDLNVACCALIFDGTSNNKREHTLFINRKLAPYQCFVTSLNEEASSDDIKDLCTHISNVMHRAGLRLLNSNSYIQGFKDLQTQLDLADKLGIPYTVIVKPESLISGLLELRSRDTTLSETIHISDIPGYLLNIFQAN